MFEVAYECNVRNGGIDHIHDFIYIPYVCINMYIIFTHIRVLL